MKACCSDYHSTTGRQHQMTTAVVVLSLLISVVTTTQVQVAPPLLFDIDPADPRLVAIYWNQNYRLKKVKEISSREVRFANGSADQELHDPWQPLLVDEEDAKKVSRFVLLRHELCREKDFRVSWSDQEGTLHQDQMVRLGPSPMPWSQRFTMTVTNVHYDPTTDTVRGYLNYRVAKIADMYLSISSQQCDTVFSRWVLQPTVDLELNEFAVPLDYLKHGCRLKVHLNTKKADVDNECWQLLRTDNEHSADLTLHCSNVTGLKCPLQPEVTTLGGCRVNCKPDMETRPVVGIGPQKPMVRVKWTAAKGQRSTLVRSAEVDYSWNNNPIARFNVTQGDRLSAAANVVDLVAFSKIAGSFYALQLCVLLDNSCSPTDLSAADWDRVPARPIYVTAILDQTDLLDKGGEPPSSVTTTPISAMPSAATVAATADTQKTELKSGALSSTGVCTLLVTISSLLLLLAGGLSSATM